MRSPCRAVVLLTLLLPLPLFAETAGEFSAMASLTEGDYGADFDARRHALTLRYTRGDRVQFRVDASLVRVDSPLDVAFPGSGGVPVDGGRRNGQGGEPGGGSGSGNGAGSGSGSGGAKSTADTERMEETGLGDIRVALSSRLFGGGVKLYRLDAGVELKLPTGDDERNLGTGEMDARFAMSGQYRFWSATGFAGLAYNRLGDPDWIDFDDVVDAYIGFESDPVFGGRVLLSSWFEMAEESVPGAGERRALGLGLRSAGGARRMSLDLLVGLSDASEDLAVVFGFSTGLRSPRVGRRGTLR